VPGGDKEPEERLTFREHRSFVSVGDRTAIGVAPPRRTTGGSPTMTQEQPHSTARPNSEGRALLAAIDALPPSAPTACTGWTAHEIVAHLTAGAKEIADLIEESIAGQPPRPTLGF